MEEVKQTVMAFVKTRLTAGLRFDLSDHGTAEGTKIDSLILRVCLARLPGGAFLSPSDTTGSLHHSRCSHYSPTERAHSLSPGPWPNSHFDLSLCFKKTKASVWNSVKGK